MYEVDSYGRLFRSGSPHSHRMSWSSDGDEENYQDEDNYTVLWETGSEDSLSDMHFPRLVRRSPTTSRETAAERSGATSQPTVTTFGGAREKYPTLGHTRTSIKESSYIDHGHVTPPPSGSSAPTMRNHIGSNKRNYSYPRIATPPTPTPTDQVAAGFNTQQNYPSPDITPHRGPNSEENQPWDEEQEGDTAAETKHLEARSCELTTALLRAREDLARASQLVLKLEARTDMATKEGIRKTLDGTVMLLSKDAACAGTPQGEQKGNENQSHDDEEGKIYEDEGNVEAVIEDVALAGEDIWKRLWLVDREMRRRDRRTAVVEGLVDKQEGRGDASVDPSSSHGHQAPLSALSSATATTVTNAAAPAVATTTTANDALGQPNKLSSARTPNKCRIGTNSEGNCGEENFTHIHNEKYLCDWLRVELRDCALAAADPCFYTAADLATGRDPEQWIAHLRRDGGEKRRRRRAHPDEGDGDEEEERKLVRLAWLFLDRHLRSPRHDYVCRKFPSTAAELVQDLEARWGNGELDGVALGDPGRQLVEDVEAWRALGRVWIGGEMG